jgi:hypothetical protein
MRPAAAVQFRLEVVGDGGSVRIEHVLAEQDVAGRVTVGQRDRRQERRGHDGNSGHGH